MPSIDQYLLTVAILIAIQMIAALGLNVITGYAGQIHLGIAAYVGIGAYTAAMLSTKAQLPFLAVLPLGVIVAALAATITGLPALRVRDDFLAVVTIGTVFVIQSLLIYLPFFGGSDGIVNIPRVKLFDWALSKEVYLLMVVGFLLLSIWICRRLVASWIGLAWETLREDELAAEVMGVNAPRFKILAFTVGGALCGLAGVLYAHFMTAIRPEDFGFYYSVVFLTMVVFGGLGTIRGALFGAAFIAATPELFRFAQDYRNLIYGGLLAAMMLFQPKGILGDGGFLWRSLERMGRRARLQATLPRATPVSRTGEGS